MKIARFWEAWEGGKVRCNLCPHRCIIQPGERGICGVRENRGGVLYSLVYGTPVAQAVDPIEKKPLFHFLPGTGSFSIATEGCNFKCLYCQNYDISQASPEESFSEDDLVMPDAVAKSAKKYGCRSIAYTYTEPTIFLEYAVDIARIAADLGLKNIFVTNGYTATEALRASAHYIHAANIDLKFFSDKLYRKICGARMQPVLDAIKLYRELGIWIEITTLVIPSYNDSEDQLQRIAEFIAGLSVDIPWHISAFQPAYKMREIPPTPYASLKKAREIGVKQGLRYVYIGNVHDRSDTVCPKCGAVLIERSVFSVLANRLKQGRCPECGTPIAGVWE